MNEGFKDFPTLEISEKIIADFATRLEKAGYSGALELIKDTLIPLAHEKKISLVDAAWAYSNPDEDQDTSYSQLFYALQNFSPEEK